MIVQPVLIHMHPDRNRFEDLAQGLNQDIPLGFKVQYTLAEAKANRSKFWHKFSETSADLIQHDKGLFIKAGRNFVDDMLLMVNL